MVNRENFFQATFALFVACEVPDRTHDYMSPSGSRYWYTPEGVIRCSDHWGHVKTCRWAVTLVPGRACYHIKTGFCRWEDFKEVPDDIPDFEFRVSPTHWHHYGAPYWEHLFSHA